MLLGISPELILDVGVGSGVSGAEILGSWSFARPPQPWLNGFPSGFTLKKVPSLKQMYNRAGCLSGCPQRVPLRVPLVQAQKVSKVHEGRERNSENDEKGLTGRTGCILNSPA